MALLSTFAVIAYSLVTVMYFEPLRDGTFKLIDLGNMQGLVSIPSFHTVLAILLSHAMRRTRVAAVFWVLNAWMIVSTPRYGSHYLVDIIAGALTAIAAIVLWEKAVLKN